MRFFTELIVLISVLILSLSAMIYISNLSQNARHGIERVIIEGGVFHDNN